MASFSSAVHFRPFIYAPPFLNAMTSPHSLSKVSIPLGEQYIGSMFVVLVALYCTVAGEPSGNILDRIGDSTFLDNLFSFLGLLAYHTICEGLHGATIGKKILKLHVVKEDGSPASIKSALIRSLAMVVDGFAFGALGAVHMRSNELRQRFGDEWAKTVVVNISNFKQFRLPTEFGFFTVFFLAIVADASFVALPMIIKLF
jgi:uncharacterized RDD family membrane protein YckC